MLILPEIILASESPARAALLRQLELPFRVIPSKISEKCQMTDPHTYVILVSSKKAEFVINKLNTKKKNFIIISCDTIVSDPDQKVLGKPKNRNEARFMLKTLSNNVHRVLSGCTIIICINQKQVLYQDVITTLVKFRNYSEEEIEYYLSKNEWENKAGAYAIQGLGAIFVDEIDGDYNNIIGLPISWIWKTLLNHFGTKVLNFRDKNDFSFKKS